MDALEDNDIKTENPDEEYTILYDKVKKNKTQAHEILPDWLTNCTKVDDSFDNSKKVSKVKEINEDIKTLLKGSFKKLFPVQLSVIPAIINSNKFRGMFRQHDICVCAPTGSGKTLAYVVPILQLLTQACEPVNGPRVLVVLPVRDLALQVFNVFNGFSKSLGIKCALLIGQKNLREERKDLLDDRCEGSLRNKVDIVVCTPGRLVDHLRNTKEVDWSTLRHMVIDEADRVLDEHKHDWYLTLTRTINASLGVTDSTIYKNIISCFTDPSRPTIQKILLSATLTRKPHLVDLFDIHYPKLFVIGGNHSSCKDSNTVVTPSSDLGDNYSAPKNLHDFFVVCNKEYSKIIFIVDQVRRLKRSKILCFTNTRDSATRLNQLLNEFKNIRSAYLSCQLHPKNRGRLRHDFEQGKLDVLVTVDSMGRGMDIEGVQCVIQYDLAAEVHTHIHRVGRTARGGQEGYAYALCTEKQAYYLKKSVSACNRQFKQHKFQETKCYKYMNEYNHALAQLQGALALVDDKTMATTSDDTHSTLHQDNDMDIDQ